MCKSLWTNALVILSVILCSILEAKLIIARPQQDHTGNNTRSLLSTQKGRSARPNGIDSTRNAQLTRDDAQSLKLTYTTAQPLARPALAADSVSGQNNDYESTTNKADLSSAATLIERKLNATHKATRIVLPDTNHRQSKQLAELLGHSALGNNEINHNDPTTELSNQQQQQRKQQQEQYRKTISKRHAQELSPECELAFANRKPQIYGLRSDEGNVADDGVIIIKAHEATRLMLIGKNLYSNISVALTPTDGAPQDDCTHTDRVKSLQLSNISLNVAEVIIELPSPGATLPFYFCLREYSDTSNGSAWFHQGSDPWLKIYVKQDFLPFYAKIITIAVLLCLSGLFSGLNLGLMALDKNELQVIMKCGSEAEKRHARAIAPVRQRGNYLLCSILFSNTLVNSTISVLLEDLSSGLVAVMASTILIVMFGEILPQAFCSRHGLAVGARTVLLTYFCMVVTFPLSYPVSYMLDLALGEEIGHAYDRERLMEFIKVTRDINNLETDEVNIISGALKIKRIQICEVMTRIEDVYMLDETAVLDFDTIQSIVEKGYSRIPVHEAGNKKNIVAVLFAKDLALVDPDDRTPVQTMISFYNHPRMFVYEDATLDKVLNEFKTGRSHMAIVQRVIDDGEHDPYHEITGIVTLEDVIEEIMQMEINDETDTISDNRRKRRRKDAQQRKDFSQFTNLGTGDSSFNVVTPQLCLAAYQYLATTVEPFSVKHISDSILKRLLSQKIFYKVKVEDDEEAKRLYEAGKPADYFIMILEGRVHVVCGKEKLVFDGGPFSFFGKAALTPPDRADSNAMPTYETVETSPHSRRESTVARPVLSRRESVVKDLAGRISLGSNSKKQSTTVEQQYLASGSDAASGMEMSALLSASTNALCTTTSPINQPIATNISGAVFFIPDYTVDIIANTSYLKVTRKDYLTAYKATQVERGVASATTAALEGVAGAQLEAQDGAEGTSNRSHSHNSLMAIEAASEGT